MRTDFGWTGRCLAPIIQISVDSVADNSLSLRHLIFSKRGTPTDALGEGILFEQLMDE